MKKLLLSALAVIVVLLLGGLAYLYFSLNILIKKGVETVGPKITGTSVTLSSAALSPFSGNGRLNGFCVGNPAGFKGAFALKLGSISVNVQKESVLSDLIVVNSVTVRSPEILLEGTPGGNNLSKLLAQIQSNTASSGNKEETSSKGSSKKFVVKEVVISAPKLHLAASALGQKVEQILPLSDIRLQNIGSAGKGVSAPELATQILTSLLNACIKEGVKTLSVQGLKQLEQQTGAQIQNTLKGIFK